MSNAYARTLFGIAACFNILAGLPLLVATQPVAQLMGLQMTPTAGLFIQITMIVVLMFGWAYWMVGRNPVRYRPYIVLGIALKILVVAVIASHWVAGTIPWPLPALVACDIVFAMLFWRYLNSTRSAQALTQLH
ncbi:hypothetical protein [Pseudomonas umsongensis]|uniref:hypothetical protein n=1 Tax=Pseudomonas umsongensis TaxID=198618 RepID=UPI0015BBB994|nr:hypothetical protein [Pseudomonas umsongensis]NWL22405.1 hypothetical protein [Pseudomonas umsongensis]